tara:strand:+ start:57 stop:815 length:759 start_codon:yes stop_codon:yes gene_type:complete
MRNQIEYISNVNGLKYISHLNKSRSIFSNFFYINPKKQYEKKETETFSKLFKKGMTFLDVGAQTGYYSLLAHSLGAKIVFSFEPDINSLKILKSNISLNNLNHKTIIFQKALYDITTKAHIKSTRMKLIPSDKRFILKETDKNNIKKKSENFIRTSAEVFDKLKNTSLKTKIDFVKMDIEGAELNALKGMKKMLKRYKPKLLISIHPQKMLSFKTNPSEIYFLLNSIGYKNSRVTEINKKLNINENYVDLFH